MPKINTFLMFNDQAEEAMNLYTSVFKNSRIVSLMRAGEGWPAPAGTVMGGNFEIDGQEFMAMNGGPHFSFAEGMSLFVHCETQEEVDRYWEKLSEGGEKQPCGWLKDKFGVSWQIVPTVLIELMQDSNPQKSKAVVEAMLQMGKLDIQALKDAYARA